MPREKIKIGGSWWSYNSYGYWLTLLGMLIISRGALGAREILSREEIERKLPHLETYLA